MKASFVRGFLGAGFLLLASAASTYSQTTGILLGSVRDQSGAVIPTAAVTVLNLDRGWQRALTTDADGHYRVPNLPTGRYTVTAERPGFKKVTVTGLTLTAGQELVQDLSLEVGEVGTVVEVKGQTEEINLTEARRSSVVTQEQVVELPVVARDITQLVLLTPGAVRDSGSTKVGYTAGGQGGGLVAVNGLRGNLQNYEIDGARANDEFWGGLSFSGYNLDAIQEFRVTSNNYSASQAGGSSSLTQVVTKSGTNTFHGTAFEFLRNDVFDARNFFAATKPAVRMNEFGGVLGGPIRKDKTFFFGEYTGFRNPSGSVTNVSSPTAAERNGVIQGVNPITGAPDVFTVPVDPRISPILALYPMPNSPGGIYGPRTFTTNVSNNLSRNQGGGRIDNRFSDRDSIFGRLTWANVNSTVTSPFGSTWDSETQFLNRNVSASYVHIFSPSMTNEIRAGYDRFVWNTFEVADPSNGDKNSGLQLADGSLTNFPGGTGVPIALHMYAFDVQDNFTFIHGKHNMEAGFSFVAQGDNGCGSGPAWGNYDFRADTALPVPITAASGVNLPAGSQAPANLGSFFNMLLANPADVYLNFGVPGTTHPCTGTRDIRRKPISAYFQDDIRVSPRLTLNLGLRYEYATVIKDARDRGTQSALTPDSQYWTGTPSIVVHPDPQYNAHRFELGPIGPRAGFAYQIQPDKTVIRGGGAVRSVIPPFAAISQAFRSFPYFAITDILNPNFNFNARQWVGAAMAALPPITQPNGTPVDLSHPAANTPITILPYVPIVGPQILTTVNQDFKGGYVADWGVTLEHRFGAGIAGSLGYVGNAGVGLLAMSWPFGFTGGDRNPPLLVANGISAVEEMANVAHSSYHGLQATARKTGGPFGSTFEVAYTFGKALDNASEAYFQRNLGVPQDPYHRNLEKGPTPFDVTHRFVFNIVQPLPFDRATSAVPRLTKGWEISSILQTQSGYPFTVYTGRYIQGRGHWVRFAEAGSRPDQIGSAAPPAGSDKTLWFNPNDFVTQVLPNGYQATDGTLGRNTMRGPAFTEWDLGLHKDTRITERVGLQFRADAYNILNQVNFDLPTATMTSPFFGRITTAESARTMQLALKLRF